MRTALIALAKRSLWRGMRYDPFLRLTRMVAEERDMFLASDATRRLGPAVSERLGTRVLRGPFAGLRYPSFAAAGSSLVPKLLGSYEEELHPAIERLCARNPRYVVNIGAGEGYYAVGLALRLPGATVQAYEATPGAVALVGDMARANDADTRVQCGGYCRVDDLRALPLGAGALVVCDCEGGEYTLINPAAVPGLASTDLLIELHRMRGRDPRRHFAPLAATHDLEFIPVRSRDAAVYPELADLPDEDGRWLVYERSDSTAGWLLAMVRHPATASANRAA